MGMPSDEYWNGNPRLINAYREAYEIRKSNENQLAWLSGLYNYRAVSSALSQFGYALGGKKGKKPEGYSERPIAITEFEKKMEKQRKIDYTLKWVQRGQTDADNSNRRRN